MLTPGRGLELKIAGYGERSVQAALSLNSLGETYLKANKITEAEEVLKKVRHRIPLITSKHTFSSPSRALLNPRFAVVAMEYEEV